jgi:Glycosyltransferases involved in cell wall biogenesis
MDRSVLVSAVIPVYNGKKTVGDCLESVFNSDYKNFEVIVVDDKSTDNSLEIISKFPCKVIKVNNNVGAAAARNRGAEASRGEVLFFLDSDIVIEKDTLDKIVKNF